MAGLGVIFFWPRHPNPDAVAREFWSSYQAQRWGDVYDMASDLEKSLQPFTREQYVGLMTDLAQVQLGEIGDATVTGDFQSQTTRKHFEFKFAYSRAAVPGTTTWIAVPFYSGEKTWHPTIYNLPLQMSTMKKPGTPESRKRLYGLCVKHGVKGFVRPYDKLSTSVALIGEYLEGKREFGTVSSYAKLR